VDRDKLSVISALTVSPAHRRLGLYLRVSEQTFNGLAVRDFVQHLLRHLRQSVVLLWDRGTIHKRRAVQHALAAYPRLHPHFFPAYAPELNPAEHVWNQTGARLANRAPRNLGQLRRWLHAATGRLRSSPPLLRACITASELPWRR
jgi:putative transposase